MKTEDLASLADAFLALCEPSRDAPFYCEDHFRLKFRKEVPVPPLDQQLARRPGDPLLRSECQDVLRSAKLTKRQMEVINQRLDGWTFEEIGEWEGHTKQGAQRVLRKGLRRFAVLSTSTLSRD
jgi:hypothetical protein